MDESLDILIKGISYGIAIGLGFIAFGLVIHFANKIKDWWCE